ncbi:DcaP family trimeric outer membrane transporter [Petrachloros mirabilis]
MKKLLQRIKMLTLVSCAVAMLAVPCVAAAADTKSPKDLTLEEKYEMQEQRIRDLEKRLQEMEAAMSGKTERKTATTPAPAPVTATAPAPEPAHTGEYKAEVREPHQVLTANELVSAEFPGSWPMFGTDLRMKIGGWIKADFLYDFNGTTDKRQFLMSSIPVKGTPEYRDSGYTYFLAQDSRFNIDVRRIKPGDIPLNAFVEGDFWGGQFRLRHAYVTAGDFMIGQNWTTLSLLETLPFIIDFAAGDALFGGRVPQLRYTKKINDQWKVAAALESFDNQGIDNPNSLGGKASAKLPQLALRADYRWSTGVLFLGTSAAQLRWDGGATGPTAKALQIDGVVAGKQFLGTDNYFTWNISYGKGSGENIIAFAGSKANAVLTADGKLDTMPAFALIVGFWHKWNTQFSSNLMYAYGWLDTTDSRDPLALKEGGIGHVNLIWQPWKQFSTGIEFMWGTQRTQNGSSGSASRIQGMAKYDF